LQQFKATFLDLKSKLDKLDPDAIRNKNLDFEVFPMDEMDRKLQGLTKHEKRQLFLTQIGYLRINLFQEYYERIQVAQERQELDTAVQLMNQYLLSVAMPYIQQRLHPGILTRIAKIFSTSTLPDASETLREWQTRYEAWKRNQKTQPPDNPKTTGDFDQTKKIFITLYTLSFSPSNFPPVAVESSH
jgi:hypothetical protein